MGKLAKCIDLVAAIFLMFLFPAVFIHVKMRDRLFEACVARVQEYGEMMQKQGYMSMDAAGHLLGENKSLEAGIFSAVRITLIQEQGGEDRPLTFRAAAEGSCDYLGTDVYPFSCGDGLLFTIQMPEDGFERAYYYFCGIVPGREHTCYFAVRDGLKERLLAREWEEGTITLESRGEGLGEEI